MPTGLQDHCSCVRKDRESMLCVVTMFGMKLAS